MSSTAANGGSSEIFEYVNCAAEDKSIVVNGNFGAVGSAKYKNNGASNSSRVFNGNGGSAALQQFLSKSVN